MWKYLAHVTGDERVILEICVGWQLVTNCHHRTDFLYSRLLFSFTVPLPLFKPQWHRVLNRAGCTQVCMCAHEFCVTRHLLSPQSQPVYSRPVRSVRQTSLRSQRSLGHTHARTQTEGLTVTVKNRVLKFSGSHLLPSEECFIHERRWGYEGRPGVSGGFTRPPWQTSSLNNYTTCERCMSSKYLKK